MGPTPTKSICDKSVKFVWLTRDPRRTSGTIRDPPGSPRGEVKKVDFDGIFYPPPISSKLQRIFVFPLTYFCTSVRARVASKAYQKVHQGYLKLAEHRWTPWYPPREYDREWKTLQNQQNRRNFWSTQIQGEIHWYLMIFLWATFVQQKLLQTHPNCFQNP